jgi:hypothetical protein
MLREHFSMLWRWVTFLLLVSSCTTPNPASCADGNCTDPSLPFCDVDGSIAGIPDTCIAVSCSPLAIVSNAPAPGITNVDPQCVNRAGGNYHIQSTSPAKDAVDTGPAFDFEGDPRPHGLRFDIGADEAP